MKKRKIGGNSQKRKGYTAELEAIKQLNELGYDAIHAGASLGPFDTWALNSHGLRLIQIKATASKKSVPYYTEIKQIKAFKAPHFATKELWVRYDRRGWERLRINDDGSLTVIMF